MKKRIIILGSVSFILDKSYVGINHIAMHFAKSGYEVTYLSSASSIFDLFSTKKRRKRFFTAWIKGGKFKVRDNLDEVIIKTPWILNKSFCQYQLQFPKILNQRVFNDRYDILIATVGALSGFSDKIKAQYKILRLQDYPYDFGISKLLTKHIEALIKKGVFNQIWSVSHMLCDYVAHLGMASINHYLPNGVNLQDFLNKFTVNMNKKCIYIGTFDSWVDKQLIIDAAKILSDWEFDLFGYGLQIKKGMPDNIKYYGAIDSNKLPELFIKYSVGIIPFKNSKHVESVERPLKFSQYLASGLGVASTSFGGLKKGMTNWAYYGNSPKEFANAIIKAYEQRKPKIEVAEYLKEYDWQVIFEKMDKLIENSIN